MVLVAFAVASGQVGHNLVRVTVWPLPVVVTGASVTGGQVGQSWVTVTAGIGPTVTLGQLGQSEVTVTGGQLGQRLVITAGPLEPVTMGIPVTPVDRRWLVRDAVLLDDLLEDDTTLELKGRPVPVERCDAVELVDRPELNEDERIPEEEPPVGLKLLVTGRVELVELLLIREEEPPVGAVTPVRIDLVLIREEELPAEAVEELNDCVDAWLVRAKATRAMLRLNFMAAGDGMV